MGEEAVNATSIDHSSRGGCLNNLGGALQHQFERTGSLEDLGRMIEAREECLDVIQVDDPKRSMYLNNLGTALQSRFQETGSIDDLNVALNRAGSLDGLGNALLCQFERMGLNAVVEAKKEAVKPTR